MQDFVRTPGRLAGMRFHARLVYSVFCVSCVAALALTAWLTEDMVGLSLDRFEAYYAGAPASGEAEAVVAEADEGGGPVLEVADDELALTEAEPIALRKLLEVTHFHLFSMPIYLLVLSHLFMLTRLGDRAKTVWIALATLGTFAHVLAPWLALRGSLASKLAFAASGGAMALAYGVMCAVPLWEMWVGRRVERP